MVFMLSDLSSSSLTSIFASILLTTLLISPILSRSSPKYVVSEQIRFSCSISFDENLAVLYLSTLISYERQLVSDLISTSSSICLSKCSFCLESCYLERSIMAWVEG